jgi:hypothetical protein
MAPIMTELTISNETGLSLFITVSEVDNFDWEGCCRPDENFDHVTIPSKTALSRRAALNPKSKSAWFRMTMVFDNKDRDEISFRNDQRDAIIGRARPYDDITGKSVSRYSVAQVASGGKNRFTITTKIG